MRSFIFFLSAFSALSGAYGQWSVSPLNPYHSPLLYAHIANNKINKHTGFAPYCMSMDVLDSIYIGDTRKFTHRKYKGWLLRKLKNEHVIEVRQSDFRLDVDPAFNFEMSTNSDSAGRRMFTNTRGVILHGTLGKRLFFNSSFYETQSIFPNYMDSVVSERGNFNNPVDPERGSIPGYGRWKPSNTSSSYDYDYQLATGTVGLALNENTFVQFGHDKQFLGYGYRSIFLSDASAPYPFVRTQFNFWHNRISYTTTWTVLQSLEKISANYNNKEAIFRRTGARFSYLHIQPVHWFGLGFFDGTTWQWNRNSFPASSEFYSPHAFVYSGQGILHHIAGMNGFIMPLRHVKCYGQLGQNLKTNRQALQAGVTVQGLLENLFFQVEFNKVGQGFYHYPSADSVSHIYVTEPMQMSPGIVYYQHNDQVLGHPIGVQMEEILFKVQYRLRDVIANVSVHEIRKTPLSGNNRINYIQAEAGYMFSPKRNWQLMVGVIQRDEFNAGNLMKTMYPYITFRTYLFNRYLDF